MQLDTSPEMLDHESSAAYPPASSASLLRSQSITPVVNSVRNSLLDVNQNEGTINGHGLGPDASFVSDFSEIGHFYRDRSVFITGATGFCGKVLVEKLLRSCSGLNKIYVLLRTKKGMNANQRLLQLTETKLFDRLREENPKAINKLVAIQGDISMPGMGIADYDMATLVNDVSIVFHSAATVRFDEPLKRSVEFNLLGTRRVIELCRQMSKLEALIHVSTAYANCDRNEVDEVLYDPPIQPQKVIDMVEWMDEGLLDHLTPKLIGTRPNTYTYTKALAEHLLVEESGSLPVAIVRPSIVTAAWREPIRGWIDNINGPTGLVLASGKGILRTMYIKTDFAADLIPVDTVINLMIAVSWYTAARRPNGIKVYNCASGTLNPITWGQVQNIAWPLILRYPSAEILRYPGGSFKSNRLYNAVATIYQHTLPAYLLDVVLKISGRKPWVRRIYDKLHKGVKSLEWFTTREWKFNCDNTLKLYDQLNGSDKKRFHFDIRELHWQTYWEDYVIGTRKYILKEDHRTLPQARKNLRRYYYLDRFLSLLLVYGLYNLLFQSTPMIKKACLSLSFAAAQFFTSFITYWQQSNQLESPSMSMASTPLRQT